MKSPLFGGEVFSNFNPYKTITVREFELVHLDEPITTSVK
jgi:hypothetical protein